ncbi:transcriptional activator xlnR [Sporothrix brasiliensis 5110]|uniref:Transcriptional activator xlnR n=1 Tax=Sporothrix brasiliensis 5110 TaxID=1398154 RepID=A0A0C2FCP1_9PEZI|nr:transcriptional activator xlnR [Sporothrix brasiliensis 5110]KIH88893.1 transcriptional activator xlnR [Sporothrix brasiliensis 5110]
MLSNPLHRFSPYHTIPTTTLLSNGHVPAAHMHAPGMDALAQGSHYALQQLQQHVGVHNPHNPHGNPHLARPGHSQQVKHRQNPYGPARGGSAAGPIRRRISRACDQCNQLRTKCDGQHPCAHCIEFGLGCEYIRERKKRGKASRKDLAQQAAAQAAAAAQVKAEGNGDDQSDTKAGLNNATHSSSASNDGHPQSANEKLMNDLAEDAMQRSQRTGSMESLSDMAGGDMHHHMDQQQHHQQQQHSHHLDGSAGGLDLNSYGVAAATMQNPYERQQQQQQQQHQQAQAQAAAAAAAAMGAGHHGPHQPYTQSQATISNYPELPYGLQTQSPTGFSTNASSFRMGTSPLSAYPMAGDTGSPPWMTMSSPPPPQHQQYPSQQQQQQQVQAQQQQQHQVQQQQQQQQHMQGLQTMHGMQNMHNMHPALAGAAGVGMSGLNGLAPGMSPSMNGPMASHHSHHNDPNGQHARRDQHQHQHQTQHMMPSSYNPTQLRYPVLEPLVPHLAGIVPLTLACDLIDLYFASSSSAQMHPMSPYVLGFVFRKRSFLHPTKPRACQPALLASMLWVAAQTSDAPFLTSVPSARGKICQKLLELTVGLLKPLIHTPSNAGNGDDLQLQENGLRHGDNNVDESMQATGMDSPVFDGVSLGGLGVAMPGTISMEAALAHATMETMNLAVTTANSGDNANGNGNVNGNGNTSGGAFGAAGTIDDVATYIHLATVVSASEYKGASLRWWNAAWSLARELKLGRELPPHATSAQTEAHNNQQGQGQQAETQARQQQTRATREVNAEGADRNERENDLMGMNGIDGINDIDGIGSIDSMDGIEAIDGSLEGGVAVTSSTTNSIPVYVISEEEREERRRIWWLVYIVDRHLALCYNRPLFLLDIECDGLLRPMDDTDWQNGEFSEASSSEGKAAKNNVAEDEESDEGVKRADADNKESQNDKGSARGSRSHRGPSFECCGHSIYGYFLPLMTILGEIVDLHHARNHPRFGLGFRTSQEWDMQMSEITRHLAIYERSLKAFEHRTLSPSALATAHEEQAAAALAAADASNAADAHSKNSQNNMDASITVGALATGRAASAPQDAGTPSGHSVQSMHSIHSTPLPTTSSIAAPMTLAAAPLVRMTELDIQTRIVVAYGTHVMHVLHILLAGKWDPVNLLDDNDLWISSQGFITATGHAVSAAEAISSILEYDPGLEFMPFFFGIYLLQGSFLLLLIADKLQLEASTRVVRACETIIRAHEACVVTLNTEYQRNFSRVMRSALAQVRGRVPEDLGEQHMRRRELLSLYRWTGDGTGLAL